MLPMSTAAVLPTMLAEGNICGNVRRASAAERFMALLSVTDPRLLMPSVLMVSREHRKTALSLVRSVVCKASVQAPAWVQGLGWRMVCSKQVLALTQTWAPQLLSSAVR